MTQLVNDPVTMALRGVPGGSAGVPCLGDSHVGSPNPSIGGGLGGGPGPRGIRLLVTGSLTNWVIGKPQKGHLPFEIWSVGAEDKTHGVSRCAGPFPGVKSQF